MGESARTALVGVDGPPPPMVVAAAAWVLVLLALDDAMGTMNGFDIGGKPKAESKLEAGARPPAPNRC